MYEGSGSEGEMSPSSGEFNPAGPQRKAPAYMFNSSEDGSDGEEMMSGLTISNKGNETGMRHANFNMPNQGANQ